ncbi:TetR/AcrR family transcriptional regulator [Nocardia sp. NPDC003693]
MVNQRAESGGVARQRRERGSIDPERLVDGAFELAEQVSLAGLSMPLLGRHLDVGVTTIYWHFHRKDDLLDAMTERALGQFAAALDRSAPRTDDWRLALGEFARAMRRTLLANPIMCDLLLVRSTFAPRVAFLSVDAMRRGARGRLDAALPAGDALRAYAAIDLHVRGSVVLQRFHHDSSAWQDRAFEVGLSCLLDRVGDWLEHGR